MKPGSKSRLKCLTAAGRAVVGGICAVGLTGVTAIAETDLPAPSLYLSFEKGLTPDIGPAEALKWSARKPPQPPQYDEQGLQGKALRITEDNFNLGFSVPNQERKRGTLLLWIKEPEGDVGSRFLCSWGPGWSGITRQQLQTDVLLGGVAYPGWDKQWTQIGLSWQNEGGGRIRLYQNGKRVQETTGLFSSQQMLIGADRIPAGYSRLIDNFAIWDRVLTDSEIKRIYRRDLQPMNQPVVSIPFLKSAPTIDGTIDSQEWGGAARITGLLEVKTGEMAADQSAFYLGYDAAYLYVAMAGEMTQSARDNPALVYEKFLRAENTGRKPKLDTDDAVEIILSPDYWQTPNHGEPGPWKEYRLLVNSVGAYSAGSYGKNSADPAWNADFKSASTASSRGGWQFEARIPLASLGAAAPKPGDRWALQLGRVWKQLKDEYDVWSWGRRLPDDSRPRLHLHQATSLPLSSVGTLRFAGTDEPLVRVEKIGNLRNQPVDFSAVVLNPAATERQVPVKLSTDTTECTFEERLTLPAGGETRFARQHRIADFGASRLTFEVLQPDGAPIHRTEVPFHIEQKFGARVVQYPNYEKFLIELDLGTLSDVPVKEIQVDLQITDSSGKTAYQKKDQNVSDYLAKLEDTTAGFKCGDYTLSGRVHRGDRTLAAEKVAFTKIGKAEWFDKRYGCEDMDRDQVPYPWTDMKVEKETVRVWGREYRFGTGLLPEQVTTLGRPILRAPMRLIVKTVAGEGLDTSQATARAKWTKTRKTRVEGSRVVKGKGVYLTNRLWAEYDGLVWCDLTVETRKEVAIASMEIEIPLTKEFTDVSWGSWLGNGDGGIQIFSEGNQFFVADKHPVRVDKDQGLATWRMVLVDKPTEFDAPYHITFGMVATPVRPKIWRTPAYDKRGATGPGAWFPQGLEFKPAADLGRDYYGGTLYIHTVPINTKVDGSGTDDVRQYGYEWFLDPNYRPPDGDRLVDSINIDSKSYRDWLVWRCWRYQQKYGLTGYYFDNPHRNALGTREVVKRLCNVAWDMKEETRQRFTGSKEFRPWAQSIGGATNGSMNMAYMAFWQYHLDGEQFNGVIQQWQTYIGHIFPADFRAEFMGHNFGWPVMFLGQGRLTPEWVNAHGGPEANIDHLQGLELLHDAPPGGWHFQGANEQVCQRAADAVKKHNLSHWIYQFFPYWHQDIVKLPDANMHASFYIAQPSKLLAIRPDDPRKGEQIDEYFEAGQRRTLPEPIRLRNRQAVEAAQKELEGMKTKAVMILYNNTAWEGEMRVKPDWKKLGFDSPDGVTAENAVHSTGFRLEKTGEKDKEGKEVEKAVFFPRPEESAKIENGELVFPMTKWNYRMIVLEKK